LKDWFPGNSLYHAREEEFPETVLQERVTTPSPASSSSRYTLDHPTR
jgi:hypothetical protein